MASSKGALSVRESLALPYFYMRFGPSGSGPNTNLVYAAKLSGRIDADALASAFESLARDTPSLRGYFSGPGEAAARLTSDQAPPFRFVDAAGDAVRFKAAVREAARRTFDLSTFPLVEVTLVRRSPTAHVLVVSAHHLLMDGWSIVMLLRALSNRYRGRRPMARKADALHDVAAEAAARATFLESEEAHVLKEAAAAWLAPAREALTPKTPVFFPMPAETHKLVRLAREPALAASRTLGLGATALHRLLFLLLQHSVTQLHVAAFSEAHANRPAHAPELYGFLSDDLMVRVDIAAEQTASDLAAAVDASLAKARSFSVLPGARILRTLNPEAAPLPRFHFNPLSIGANALRLPGARVSPFKIMPAYSVAELVFVSGDLERTFVALAHGHVNGFDLRWIDRRLNDLLAGLAKPGVRVGELAAGVPA